MTEIIELQHLKNFGHVYWKAEGKKENIAMEITVVRRKAKTNEGSIERIVT